MTPDDKCAVYLSDDNAAFKISDALFGKQDWLQRAAQYGGTKWAGPVFDSMSYERIVYCNMSFEESFSESGRTSIIFVYTVRQIFQKLLGIGLNSFGFPYIMDDSTNFIVHPLDEIRSLLELGYDYRDNVLVKLCNDVIQGRPLKNNYRHSNSVTKQTCNEVLYRMDKTGWLLGLSVYDGVPLESAEYQKTLRHDYIRLIFFVAAFLMLLCVVFQNYKHIKLLTAFLYPLILLTATVCVVAVYNRYPQQSRQKNADIRNESETSKNAKWDLNRIISQGSLDAFIAGYQQESKILYNERAKSIPTGIYIYSATFVNPYTIKITGTFWQKYLISGKSYPEKITEKYLFDTFEKKGVLFPGGSMSNLEQTDIIETKIEGYPAALYRWNFDVEIEQQLSYSHYPFGKNEISMVLWSADLDNNVILTPDLESYKQMYPTDKPGLHNSLHLNKWNVQGAYYSYSMESYLCSFGNLSMQGTNRFPELMFNISVSRKFIDILISKIIPLMIVLVLLFTVLFVRVKSDGFNTIIGCSSLFFVLLIDHINLRESVSSEEIMFLEYGYFFSYILLLLVTVTSFDILKRSNASYDLNVDSIMKKYFWTIVTGATAAVTAIYFW